MHNLLSAKCSRRLYTLPIIPSKSFQIREEMKKRRKLIKHTNLNPPASYDKQCIEVFFFSPK